MATLDEAVSTAGGAQALLEGLRVLSVNEAICFTQYVRKVLPLDGYVFWLKTDECTVQGSLHQVADKRQLEDETITINRILFTTGQEVEQFNRIGPGTIWVGIVKGIKFAFTQQGPFYRASNLFHYSGDAVYPALESQLVDVGQQFDDSTLIVSNSLPAWLQIPEYNPIWINGLYPGIPLFPSFAVPANLPPPYGSVHIDPTQTQFLQAIPRWKNNTYSWDQTTSDNVRLTLYGATNDQAGAVLETIYTYSRDTDVIGIMTPAVIRDEKRTQAELGILAMKKTMEFVVSYNQRVVSDVATQLFRKALATFLPSHEVPR